MCGSLKKLFGEKIYCGALEIPKKFKNPIGAGEREIQIKSEKNSGLAGESLVTEWTTKSFLKNVLNKNTLVKFVLKSPKGLCALITTMLPVKFED